MVEESLTVVNGESSTVVNEESSTVVNDESSTPLPNGLSHSLSLTGQHVALEPLAAAHVDALILAATDGELWKLPYTAVPDAAGMANMVSAAIALREQGAELPFAVRRLSDGKIVGSTRYYFISPHDRNLSIGYTWYAQSAQRTAVNTECKLLLLEHAFERLKCISVQWHTHHDNKRSQAAIQRLGAKFEGVLRNNKIMPDGSIRHTHCFSMLDTEWPESKQRLIARLNHYRTST
ncbi:GNAT family N-acetyltransferase [Arenicella xantha]|uniref:RimJ/RimL family protein N-acetyltransferase n=1 Tax=Arenicella xantha TaxID=644221 RepID=A0A395JL19_9GAMM|nr:GNAT family protein [Arenicella xantha]RBP48426.1 RimJ/RimL family protein N-acetyltransferase [Arenicella xantha]